MSMIVIGDARSDHNGLTLVSGVPTTTSGVILGPFNLYNYKEKSFTLYNFGPVTLSGAVVQINADHQGVEYSSPNSALGGDTQRGPNPGLWETIDSTSFNSLASGSVKSVQIAATAGATMKWWRVQATAHIPGVQVSGWMYARTL